MLSNRTNNQTVEEFNVGWRRFQAIYDTLNAEQQRAVLIFLKAFAPDAGTRQPKQSCQRGLPGPLLQPIPPRSPVPPGFFLQSIRN